MSEFVPDAAPVEQAAPAPLPQATQQAPTPSEPMVPQARLTGAIQTLQQKDQLLKAAEAELAALRNTTSTLEQQAQTALAEKAALSTAKDAAEAALVLQQAELARFQVFAEFPDLLPIKDSIELKGTPEEQRATLEKIHAMTASKAEQAAQAQVEQALAGLTPSLRPQGNLSPADEAKHFQGEWMKAIGRGDDAAAATFEKAYLDANQKAQQGTVDPWAHNNAIRTGK